jgi:hypothetical protein
MAATYPIRDCRGQDKCSKIAQIENSSLDETEAWKKPGRE